MFSILSNKMNNKAIDIAVLIVLMLLASVYAYVTRDMYVGKSIIVGAIFTLPPALYMGLREKKNWKKIGAAVFLFGLLWGFAFAFIAELTLSWEVLSVVIPHKLFGVHSVDTTLGIMLMTFLTVVFYEHFIDDERDKKISHRYKISLLPVLFIIAVMLALFFINPLIFGTRYAYFILGITATAPALIFVIVYPQMLKKLLVTSVYFFFLYFVMELFAVAYDWWVYPGSYVGFVSIFDLTFPFEELFFWMMFYAASLVAYYEFFVDDNR